MQDLNYISIIGLIAGTCTTVSFVPQVVKSYRLRETKDLSLLTYTVLAIGILLWTIYGILINDVPVITANAISFVFACSIVALKIKYG